MLAIPYSEAISFWVCMSTLPKITSGFSSAIFIRTGVIALHGGHHGAQKLSTSVLFSLETSTSLMFSDVNITIPELGETCSVRGMEGAEGAEGALTSAIVRTDIPTAILE